MTVCGLTIGLQWLQMVNGVLNLNIRFWWVFWVCLRGSILEAVYHADDFVVQERTNTSRASAMLLILWVWQNLKSFYPFNLLYMMFYAPGDRDRMWSFDGTVTLITGRFSMVEEAVMGHCINSNKKVILIHWVSKKFVYSSSVGQSWNFQIFQTRKW